jgi:hypothetical protein
VYSYTTEIAAATEQDARAEMDVIGPEDVEITEVKGDNSDPLVAVPWNRRVLVRLETGKFVIATVHGWFRGKPGYADAQDLQFGEEEIALTASVEPLANAKSTAAT